MKHNSGINGELKVYLRQIYLGVGMCIKLVKDYFSKMFDIRDLDPSD